MTTTIIIADDHPIVRHGLRTLLEAEADYEVIGEAEDGITVLKLVEQLKPDVLVVDVMMPGLNGLEVTKRIRNSAPGTQVIVLSMHSNEPYVLEALRNGAAGYVLKATSIENLVQAVRLAATGQRYLSPTLNELAIEAYVQKVDSKLDEVDGYKILTAREREVFQLSVDGLSNAQIAEKLSISPRTVETHRTNFMRKLRLRTETELVRYAVQHGFIGKT